MKLNRKWLLVIALVMSMAMATGGTLAYLTDRESEVNVFTMGNVNIKLTEDFAQGSKLIPGVKISKEVQIENTGSEDAWVWYTYAVPTNLIDTGANASKNAVHFNIPGRYWDSWYKDKRYWAEGQTEPVALNQTWHWEKMETGVKTIEDDVDYTVVTVLYNGILKSGDITTLGLEQVYLDTRVDITPEGDMYWVEDGGKVTDLHWNINDDGAPKIYVSAYAIQAQEFDSVNAAYAAYNKQWGTNGGEYATTKVTNSTEAYNAIKNAKDGDTITFAAGTYEGLSFNDPANYTAKNLKLVGEDGAILNGLSFNGWSADKNIKVDGLTISNFTFTSDLLLSTKEMTNVTVQNCDFVKDACIHQNDSTELLTNLVVKNCTFTGDKSGNTTAIMLENTENLNVTGCTFTNIDFNVLQAGIISGEILFDSNKVNNTGDRVFRFVHMNGDMTISNNTIVSGGDEEGELAKASNVCAITLNNNTWNDKTDTEVADNLVNITAK